MRHLRIPGQNIKNLSVFKNQIGGLLRQLNKFDSKDQTEALSYVRKYIGNNEAKPSTSSASPNNDGRKRTRRKKFDFKPKKRIKLWVKNSIKNNKKRIIYSCEVCSITERAKWTMLRHLQTHVGVPLSCLRCRKTFNGQVAYKWHLGRCCTLKKYQRRRFKCTQCQRDFVTRQNLQAHILGHQRNNCTYCDKILTHRKQLVKHLLEVHAIKLEREIFKCQYCEKRYIKPSSLYYHTRQHVPDKIVCLECGVVSDNLDDSVEHRKSHNEKKHFACSKCGDRFSRRQQYLCHLKRHDRYKCVTCTETFASRAKVTRHRQMGHEVEGLGPRFLCPHCSLTFHRGSIFQVHLKKHAEDVRSINCKYCKMSFTSPYAYFKHCITVNHERFSPETSNIVCEKCDRRFNKKFELRQHIYRVHNHNRKVIQCQHCDYKTALKSNMERHVALHFRTQNQYICEHCGKSFDSKANVQDHVSYSHLQQRLFSCGACSKSFKRKSELVRHEKTHSEERPHVCLVCGKSYKRLNHLTRHEKSAHEITTEKRKIKIVSNDSVREEQELNPTNLYEIASLMPEKGWEMSNEDMYKIYSDVNNS